MLRSWAGGGNSCRRTICGAGACPTWWLVGWLLGLGLPGSSRAQDVIIRTDSARIEATVLKVSGQEVFYHPWKQPDNVTTVLDAAAVAAIRYANGYRFTFPAVAAGPTGGPSRAALSNGLNVLSIRPSDFLFNNLTFSYERLLGPGRVGLKVPLTLGLKRNRWDCYGETSTFYQSNKIFSTGLELNVYSNPKKGLRFFGGPALQYGRFYYPYISPVPYTYTYTILFFFPYTVTETPREVKVGTHTALVAQAGLTYLLFHLLVIGADAGLGWQITDIDRRSIYRYSDQLAEFQLLMSANLNLGFTF